jgi:hypothetical protein
MFDQHEAAPRDRSDRDQYDQDSNTFFSIVYGPPTAGFGCAEAVL